MEEVECSVIIKLSPQTLGSVRKVFAGQSIHFLEKHVNVEQHARVIKAHDELRVETKTKLQYRKKLCLIHGYMVEVLWSRSLETPCAYDPNMFAVTSPNVYRLVREYFYLDKIRVALDHHTNTGVYSLCIELDPCTTFKSFVSALEARPTINALLKAAFYSHVSLVTIKIDILQHTRRFVYTPPPVADCKRWTGQGSVRYAPKLDGIKYGFYISNNELTIPELNRQLPIAVDNGGGGSGSGGLYQNFTGAVEYIPHTGQIFLIDLTAVINEQSIVFRISPLDACRFIEMLPEFKHVCKNTFSRCATVAQQMAAQNTSLYDGWLTIYPHVIVKSKRRNTVDILFSKIKRSNIKLINLPNFLFLQQNKTEYITLKKHGFGIEGVDITEINRHKFIVLECDIDFEKKKFIFLKYRQDKSNPNTVYMLNTMAIQ